MFLCMPIYVLFLYIFYYCTLCVTSIIGIYHTEHLVNRFALYFCRVLGQVSCELVSPNSIGQQKVFFLTLNSRRWLPQLLELAGI